MNVKGLSRIGREVMWEVSRDHRLGVYSRVVTRAGSSEGSLLRSSDSDELNRTQFRWVE